MTTIQVYANNQHWMRTGMTLQPGDMIKMTGTGMIKIPRLGPNKDIPITGNSTEQFNGHNAGALLYKVGNGSVHTIGDTGETHFSVPQNGGGELMFAVNWGAADSGTHNDRDGHFTVEYHLIERDGKQTATLEVKSDFSKTTVAGSSGPAAVMALEDDPLVYIMVDHSGSMKNNDRDKQAVAAVQQVVDELPQGIKVGMQYFGLGDTCKDAQGNRQVKTVVDIGPLNDTKRQEIYSQLEGYKPNGYTPILWALEEAKTKLAQYTSKNKQAVLITDGGETCATPEGQQLNDDELAKWRGEQIIQAVQNLAGEQNVETVLNMVGVQLGQGGKAALMKECAKQGHGTYYDVKDVDDFTQALMQASSVKVTVWVGAQKVEGYIDGPPIVLPLDGTGFCIVQVHREHDMMPKVMQNLHAGEVYTLTVKRTSS